MKTMVIACSAFLALATVVAAQEPEKARPARTESVWQADISGIGG